MNFKNYLLSMLTETQVEVLRICLRDNSPVHIYGPQGSGKTMLVEGLRKLGFQNITEPCDIDFELIASSYSIPISKEELTALRLNKRPSDVWVERHIPFEGHEDEIMAWIFGTTS